MLKTMTVRATIAAIVAGLSMSAHAIADSPKPVDIPAGDLRQALLKVSEQFSADIVFSPEHVQGFKTGGAHGQLTTEQAVTKLLEGTPLELRTDPSGAMLIAPPAAAKGLPQASTNTERPKSFWSRLRLAQADTPSPQGEGRGEDREQAAGNQKVEDPAEFKLEEVLVTAQKRTERLQDVPVPVTAISAETISSNNQLRIQDYYTKVPGLSMALISDSAPTVAIRGLTMGGATNPTVGIVIDEVPYGSSVTIGNDLTVADIDPSELAHVEVLRGPQGTLYGASSLGGLLKFATVDPSTEAFSGTMRAGMVSVEESDDLGYDVYGSVNVPLADTFSIRGSGFSKRAPGYIDNVQIGEKDVNRTDNVGGRLAALWSPSDDLSLKLSAFRQAIEREASAEVHLLPGLGDLQQSSLRGSGGYDRDTEAYAATLQANLGSIALTSASGYSVDDTHGVQDVSSTIFADFAEGFFGVRGAADFFSRKVEKFSQELRFSIPIGTKVDWLIGGFYTRERTDAAADFTAVDPDSGAKVGRIAKVHTPDNRFDEYAAFTNLTYHFTDQFDVQIGGRYSENRQSYASATTGALRTAVIDRFHTDDHAFTYLVTPRFRISQDLMVYGRFASGYRPGAPNVNCGIVPCGYAADTTENYEVGIKGSALEQRLSYEASLYYIDWKDIQLESTTPDGLGYVTNGESATSQGVELSVEVRPLTGLTISAWVAWNDAELAESFPAEFSSNIGFKGDQLPYGSPLSGNVSLEQEFPVGALTTGFAGGSFSYVDERQGVFPSVFSESPTRQVYPSYTQLDLHGGLRWESWTINLFVNNVTDKRALLGGDAGNFIPFAFSYSQPRTMGLSVAKTF